MAEQCFKDRTNLCMKQTQPAQKKEQTIANKLNKQKPLAKLCSIIIHNI